MNIFRKFGLAAVVLTALMAFSACVPGAAVGEGGGDVLIGGQPAGGTAVAQQPGAPAETGGGTGGGGGNETAGGMGLITFLPIILIFVVMYFLMIRPQRKQMKATQVMQSALAVGDNVVTTSGFYGKIIGVGTDSFLVEFGEGKGFKVWVRKSDIAGIKTPIMTPPEKAES